MSDIKFSDLRRANVARLPLFRNARGEIAHPVADGSDWSIADWTGAVTGELGEFANLAKKVRRGDLTMDEARPALAKELADVQCYLDILAMRCGVDLGDAVVSKFNEVSRRIGVDLFIDDTTGKLYTTDVTLIDMTVRANAVTK